MVWCEYLSWKKKYDKNNYNFHSRTLKKSLNHLNIWIIKEIFERIFFLVRTIWRTFVVVGLHVRYSRFYILVITVDANFFWAGPKETI